jgi:hypothetical protein
MTVMLTIASGAASGTASNRLAPNEPGEERVVASRGDGARLRADHAGRIADAARLAVEDAWGTAAFATAVGNLTEVRPGTAPDGTTQERAVPRRVVVGNLGYDVSFTLPKSYSLLLAFADSDTAAAVEAVYTERVGRTFGWLEPVRRRDARPPRGRPGRGHGGRGSSAGRWCTGRPGRWPAGRWGTRTARARDLANMTQGRRRPLVDGGPRPAASPRTTPTASELKGHRWWVHS